MGTHSDVWNRLILSDPYGVRQCMRNDVQDPFEVESTMNVEHRRAYLEALREAVYAGRTADALQMLNEVLNP